MDSGFYAACTGLLAKTDALDVAANNIANIGTTGYKAQMEFYQSLTASMNGKSLSPLNQAVNDILAMPDVQQRLDAVGFTPNIESLADTDKRLATDLDKWRTMVRALGMKIK